MKMIPINMQIKVVYIIAFSLVIIGGLLALSFREKETTSENPGAGIIFFEGTWNEALAKSKAENKPIFLDLYATWCGPCKMLKRKTFSDKECGTYFNASFINVELDGEQGDGLALAEKFKLTAYPSLYIVDTSGNVIIHSAGYLKPDELINFGKQGISKMK